MSTQRKRPRYPGIRKRGGRWQVHAAAGERVYRSFRSLDEARAWQIEREREFRAGLATEKSETMSLHEAAAAYLGATRDLGSQKAQRERELRVQWWCSQLGNCRLAEVSPVAVRRVRKRLLDSGRSAATANRYTSALSRLLAWAVEERGWLKSNPARQVRRLSERARRFRVLDERERRALLEACRNSRNWRVLPMVSLALLTGMRRGEIEGLRWSEVDLARGMIRLRGRQKSRSDEEIPLVPAALELLEELSRTRRHPSSDLVFASKRGGRPYIRKPLEVAYQEAGVHDVEAPFHVLRYTAASRLLEAGVDIQIIGQILRHQSGPAMAARYARLLREQLRSPMTALEGLI